LDYLLYHLLAIVMVVAIIRGVLEGSGNLLGMVMALMVLGGCIQNIKEEKQLREQKKREEEGYKRRETSPFIDPDSEEKCYKWPLKEGVVADDAQIINNSLLYYREKSNFDAVFYFIERLYDMGSLNKYLTPDSYLLIASNRELREYKNMKNDVTVHLYSHMDTVSRKATVVEFMKLIQYYEFNDIDQIIKWCRSRTEHEIVKAEGADGYSLTEHFLVLKEFLPERYEDESIRDFSYRISDKYKMPELRVNYACVEMCREYNKQDTIGITNALVDAARAGSYIAKMFGITRHEFIKHWQTSTSDDYGFIERMIKHNISSHRYSICEELLSMKENWFEKTVESSQIRCREYKSMKNRARARYQYWKGMRCYALGDEDSARSYMEMAAESDNPEALFWFSRYARDSKYVNRYVYEYDRWPKEWGYADSALKDKSVDAIVDLAELIRRQYLENGDEIIKSLYDDIKEFGTEEAVFAWLIHLDAPEFQSTVEDLMNSTEDSPQARMYRRMAYLAKALSQKNIKNMLAFADVDLDKNATYKFNEATNGNLLKQAYKGNLNAITDLGKIYLNRKEPWMYNALGDAMLGYVSDAYEERYNSGYWDDQDIIDWYHLENAIRERKELSYDIFKLGLKHHITRFCVKAYWLREELDLGKSEIDMYLEIARKNGYDITSELENIREDQRSVRREEQREIDRREQEEKRRQDAKRAAFDARLDMLERDIDRMNGGSGYTLEEKAASGSASVMDHLRNQAMRDVFKEKIK